MTPLPTRDELVQALATVDGNQRSRPLILDRLYGPLADGVLELLRQGPPQVVGEDVERVAWEAEECQDALTVALNSGSVAGLAAQSLVDQARVVIRDLRTALSARPVEAQEVERLRQEIAVQRKAIETGPDDADLLAVEAERDAALARAEAAEGRERALREALAAGEASDGHHTHSELYDYRMLYNAHAARGWLAAGIPVVKSWRHSDGEECFGGGWFIVTATLPTGQVSNHYRAEHWDLFDVPAVDLPPDYDGHTPADAADRLRALLDGDSEGREAGHQRLLSGYDVQRANPRWPNLDVDAVRVEIGPISRPACGHWVTGRDGAVILAPEIGCPTGHPQDVSERP